MQYDVAAFRFLGVVDVCVCRVLMGKCVCDVPSAQCAKKVSDRMSAVDVVSTVCSMWFRLWRLVSATVSSRDQMHWDGMNPR